jgi:hypothetical protein
MKRTISNFLKTQATDLKETPNGTFMEDIPKNRDHFRAHPAMRYMHGYTFVRPKDDGYIFTGNTSY